MTIVVYECMGEDGEKLRTKSLSLAQQFISDHGGTYKMIDETIKSSSEGYARKDHRNIGDKGGK